MLPKTGLCKFPLLLKLSPTNLEWPASLFGPFLPSVCGASFQVHQLSSLDGSLPCISDGVVPRAFSSFQNTTLTGQDSGLNMTLHSTVLAATALGKF